MSIHSIYLSRASFTAPTSWRGNTYMSFHSFKSSSSARSRNQKNTTTLEFGSFSLTVQNGESYMYIRCLVFVQYDHCHQFPRYSAQLPNGVYSSLAQCSCLWWVISPGRRLDLSDPNQFIHNESCHSVPESIVNRDIP